MQEQENTKLNRHFRRRVAAIERGKPEFDRKRKISGLLDDEAKARRDGIEQRHEANRQRSSLRKKVGTKINAHVELLRKCSICKHDITKHPEGKKCRAVSCRIMKYAKFSSHNFA